MKFVSRTQRFFRTCFFVDLSDWKQTVDNFCFLHGDDCNSGFFIRSLAVILLMNSSLLLNSVKERGVTVLLFWSFFVRWNLPGLIWVSNLLFGWIWRWFVLPCFSPISSSENFFAASHWAMRSNNCLLCFPIEVILLPVYLQVSLVYLYFHEIHLTLLFWILQFLVLVPFL